MNRNGNFENVKFPSILVLTIVSLVFSMMSCSNSKEIAGNGLQGIEIGKNTPLKGKKRWKGRAVRDTLLSESGFNWKGSILKYRDGTVLVEEDFGGQGLVNRIRIETSKLSWKDSLRVGNTLSTLVSHSDSWLVSYLVDYELYDLVQEEHPSVHFLVSDKGNVPDSVKEGSEAPQLNQIDPLARIVSIVVM